MTSLWLEECVAEVKKLLADLNEHGEAVLRHDVDALEPLHLTASALAEFVRDADAELRKR